MAQTIQFKRRFDSVGAPGSLEDGEPAFNDPGGGTPSVLYIGGTAGVAALVGPTRQLELTGAQQVTGAANAKTFDIDSLRILGGGANDILGTDGAGVLDWVSLSDLGGITSVTAQAPLTPATGGGIAGTPLGLTVASSGQITTGTDNVYPVSSAGLRGVSGDLTALSSGITQTDLVAAINSIAAGGIMPVVVTAGIAITGSGTTASPLNLTVASSGDIGTGTNNTNPVTALGLRGVTGNLTTLSAGIAQTDLVAAINSIHTALSDGTTVTVVANAPLTGDGTTADPLELTIASGGDISGGTNNVNPVSSLGLRGVTGDLTTLASGITQTNLVAAINSVHSQVAAISFEVDDPITGSGTTGDPFTVTPATTAQIQAGLDDTFPITSLGLRNQLGAQATAANLGTTASTVVPAIYEIAARVGVLSSAIRLVGTFAAPNTVTPVVGSPLSAGALPPASADNTGFAVIATVGGSGTGTAPNESIAVGDLIISSGSAWVLVPLNLGVVAAANVTVAAISGLTATNAQAAFAEIMVGLDNALTTVYVDGESITGDGIAAASALSVATIDGGLYT